MKVPFWKKNQPEVSKKMVSFLGVLSVLECYFPSWIRKVIDHMNDLMFCS